MALLGIDLGTSGVKAVVIDEAAKVVGVGFREIPMEVPRPGRAEQDAEAWWSNTVMAVRQALHEAGRPPITGIGCDGHMHGGVLLDAAHRPLGRAITWADQRTADLIPELEAEIGVETYLAVAGTRPAAGFMGPTMAWLRRHDPERLDAAATFLLPKDFVRLRLTGTVGTDISDASGTALFDVGARTWSHELTERQGAPTSILPPLQESADVAGGLSKSAAAVLGLAPGTPVATGCSDQCAQAAANGLVDRTSGSVAIGTGGQIVVVTTRPMPDPQGRIHTFCHAVPDRWYQLGATLSAGLSLRWLRDRLRLTSSNPYATMGTSASQVAPGAEGLIFLPYLVGERSPIMEPDATGAFIGLTYGHRRAHLTRAVMEGVACSLRATRDAVVDAGGRCDRWLAVGNGLSSPIWRSILADLFAEPLSFVAAPERPATGAALIGGIAAGVYAGYEEAAEAATPQLHTTEPDPERVRLYEELYERFSRLSSLLLNELG
ncbi:MAG: xylulokinase [Candidatus Limnocylindrales bacterium]